MAVDGHMWGDATGAQILDELAHVTGLVGAKRDSPSSIASAASRSAVPVAGVTAPSTARPWRFSISGWPR
jgi:hypothetical protein